MGIKLPDTKKYKLISVDVFDTLLLRAVAKPSDVFSLVWERGLKNDLAATSISPKEYEKLRVEMERRARAKGKNREVTLEEIYREYPNYIAKDIPSLMELEIDCEKEVCYSNDHILHWLLKAKQEGCILALVSDMYLSKKTIIELLENANVDTSIFDTILISNEHHCNKQDGQLFSILQKHYKEMEPKEMLHIGDHPNSDVTQPIKQKMNAFHYDPIVEQMYSIFDYEKIRHNIPQPELVSLRKLCMAHHSYEGREKTAYEIGSGVIGPVLTLYISWVCQRMTKLGIKRIYPLMREGYLLGELLKEEAKEQSLDLKVHPIYISRKVTYVPSIENIDREEIENMIGARNLTIRESIALMGLNLDNFKEIQPYFDIVYKESHKIKVGDTTLKERVIHLFLQKENQEKMLDYVAKERKKLTDYLLQEMGDVNNVATIDIGFFGRIQMWMEKSLDIEKIPHKCKHFLAIGITGDKVYDGLDFEGMFGTYGENQDLIPTIHRTTDVLEKLISVTEGSTIGYECQKNLIIPVKAQGLVQDNMTKIVFEGVMAFQKEWFSFRRKKPAIASKCLENKRDTLKILHRLIDLPKREEAVFLADFEADTNFGTNYKKSIITKEHLALAKEKGLDFIDRCNVSYTYENSNITWPKGTITMLDEFYYVRRALKNDSQNDIIKSMQQVVEQVQEAGICQVALYGAGENGRQFYFLCQMYNIKVDCFIDRKESLWGSKKEGVQIMGIDEAIENGYDNYIVTSLFSISEIRDVIEEKYKKKSRTPKVYSV